MTSTDRSKSTSLRSIEDTKSYFLGLLALSTFGQHANAKTVHIDVSVDIETGKQQPVAPVHREKADALPNPPRRQSFTLKVKQVDLGYEVHEGFPSVTFSYLNCHTAYLALNFHFRKMAAT